MPYSEIHSIVSHFLLHEERRFNMQTLLNFACVFGTVLWLGFLRVGTTYWSVYAADSKTERPDLDEALKRLEIPPTWIPNVRVRYDTTKPWKEARLEARRLLAINKESSRREGVKLTWLYYQMDNIGDGHEYPQNLFIAGEKVWAVKALRDFLKKPRKQTPVHLHLQLASLLVYFEKYDQAKETLDQAMKGLPPPPWRIARTADIHAAYGDLYAAWSKMSKAKDHYQKAIRLYPTSDQPYGRHLLKRRADKVQLKWDRLSFEALESASLRDGAYTGKALGYVEDIYATVKVAGGKISSIQVKHKEKIDQNACVIIPDRIVKEQSLQVDGITGATVTVDAIINGTYRALKKAGLD